MNGKLRKILAAALAATVLATSACVSASASEYEASNNNIYVDVDAYRKSNGEKVAQGYGKNYTQASRLMMVQVFICKENRATIEEEHKSAVLGYGSGLFSPEASTYSSEAYYAEASVVLYNGNVVISGQYDSLRTTYMPIN